jgi:Zn-dependent protease
MEPTSPLFPAEPQSSPFAPAPPAPELPRDGTPFASTQRSWLRRKLGAGAAAIVALLAKLKAMLLLVPKFKLLATAGTMIVSIIAYGSIWGLAFAAGFVVLILVHELGHVIQLRREGIKATPPIFIPFLGAVIGSRSLGDSALAEARVGLAGPILGTVGAAACLVIWHLTGNDLWRALAYTGFFLNLFNLIPIVPLDGGRAMAATTPWMWLVGFAGLAVLAFAFPNPVFILILILGAYESYRRWRQHRGATGAAAGYYKVSPRNRALVVAAYVVLIGLLVLGMHAANLPRTII